MRGLVVIIPIYRHVESFRLMLPKVLAYGLPLIAIDDGNTNADKEILSALSQSYNFTLCSHSVNLGKGAAVYTGLEEAWRQGFTGALQIDGDGQHEVSDIPKFIEAFQIRPDALILGQPIFDADAPFERVWGRKITTLFVWLETLSFQIKDALFGFRVYPVELTLRAYSRTQLRERMGFDVESLVRLLWEGCRVRTIKTPVYYPENGISNFRYLSDNIQMILMHVALLIKAPYFNIRKLYRKFSGVKVSIWS